MKGAGTDIIWTKKFLEISDKSWSKTLYTLDKLYLIN